MKLAFAIEQQTHVPTYTVGSDLEKAHPCTAVLVQAGSSSVLATADHSIPLVYLDHAYMRLLSGAVDTAAGGYEVGSGRNNCRTDLDSLG